MDINKKDTAVLVTDPQNDFLSEKGVTWALVGDSVKENNTVANIDRILRTAKDKGFEVFVSPHYYYPTDHAWQFGGTVEKMMHEIKMFDRDGALSLDGFSGSGADWLFARLQRAELALDALPLSDDERRRLSGLHERARQQAACVCDVDEMEREEQIEGWLDDHGVPEPWERAPQLVGLNFTTDDLDELAQEIGDGHLAPVLEWLAGVYSVYLLLDEIHHGAGQVSEIVGALKSYSYLGQAPVQDVDVNEGVRQTLVILRNQIKKGVEVTQELAEDLPRIHAFGSELNQVWTNLIDNAVGAMDGEGKIVLRSFRDNDAVVVEVQDDGPGVPPDVVGRIFDPFFTTKAPGQGTGLGLHTCHSIVVKKHGGTLDVASRPGETRFVVRLPIDGPPTATQGAETPREEQVQEGAP